MVDEAASVPAKRGVGHSRKPFERMEHRTEIARYLRRGWSNTRIAQTLGLGDTTVAEDIKVITKEWASARHDNLDHHFGRILANLDEMEAEAWAAWERSKAPSKRTRVETDDDAITLYRRANGISDRKMAGIRAGRDDADRRWEDDEDADDEDRADDDERGDQPDTVVLPKKQRRVRETRQRDGNPEFLTVLAAIQDRKAKLLGYDKAPAKDGPGENGDGSITLPLSVFRERAPLINSAVDWLKRKYPDAEIGQFREIGTGEGAEPIE